MQCFVYESSNLIIKLLKSRLSDYSFCLNDSKKYLCFFLFQTEMPILRGENRVLKDERFLLEKNKHWEKDFFFIQVNSDLLCSNITYLR